MKLHIVHTRKPTFADLRKALSLFRSDMVSRSVRHANARQWLRKMDALGNHHVYKGGEVKWGHNVKGTR